MNVSPRELVERFYHEVWNHADEAKACQILSPDFKFRGSLGPESHGRDGFLSYMRAIHVALADFTCIIDDLIVSENRAAARMTFRGFHRARSFGVEGTAREVSWAGSAFYTTDGAQIIDLWVLGDVDGLKRQLGAQSLAAL